jgi:hypothetical protein
MRNVTQQRDHICFDGIIIVVMHTNILLLGYSMTIRLGSDDGEMARSPSCLQICTKTPNWSGDPPGLALASAAQAEIEALDELDAADHEVHWLVHFVSVQHWPRQALDARDDVHVYPVPIFDKLARRLRLSASGNFQVALDALERKRGKTEREEKRSGQMDESEKMWR